MEHIWKVTVWGVRGSFPMADARFLRYGGNTSCISAEHGGHTVVFDAGSGLVSLGNDLLKRGRKSVALLLGHLHIDHVMGLFRFPLLYDREAEIHIYGAGGSPGGLKESLEMLAGPPWWPVRLSECPAQIYIHEVSGKDFTLSQGEEAGQIRVSSMSGNHPGGSLIYRVEAEDVGVVYVPDCEMDPVVERRLERFAGECALMIWDANFTERDHERHKGWGHSSWEEGAAFGRRAGISRMLMTHYWPEYTDEFLKNEEDRAKLEYERCEFAKEGMVIRI